MRVLFGHADRHTPLPGELSFFADIEGCLLELLLASPLGTCPPCTETGQDTPGRRAANERTLDIMQVS